jgi:molecular chaperone GrpE
MSSNPTAPSETTTPSTNPVSTAPSAAVPTVEELQSALDAARAETAQNMDKFLRAKAETENIRRRAETDLVNAHKFSIERFALEMLAVKDSLERARAVEVQANGALIERLHEGLDLTLKLMDNIFGKFALAVVDPQKGDKFDPERHMAMSLLESPEVSPNHIIAVVQKGYLLHNRLLRPAVVVVAKDSAGPAGNA